MSFLTVNFKKLEQSLKHITKRKCDKNIEEIRCLIVKLGTLVFTNPMISSDNNDIEK